MSELRDLYTQVTDAVKAVLGDGESYLLIGFGVARPDADCPATGSVSVTLKVGEVEETSWAVNLQDAVLLARAKCKAKVEKNREEKSKASKAIHATVKDLDAKHRDIT